MPDEWIPSHVCAASEREAILSAETEAAFATLLATHGPSLGRLARSYTRDRAESEDLYQEIAIAIWRALPSFRNECSERTFVFRIAHNRAMSHLARRRPFMAGIEGEREAADTRPNAEQQLATYQERDRLFAAVQRLPLGSRQVLMLSLEGMAYTDIAEVLGITETNVGARLTRAREKLRALLRSGGTDGNG